jgi:hypothetical protein
VISSRPATRSIVAGPLVVLPVLLAACATAGDWTKAGTDAATSAADNRDCRGVAMDAVKPAADIDQDIAAARQSDLQRAAVVRAGTETMQGKTSDRADTIIAACMRALGYRQRP